MIFTPLAVQLSYEDLHKNYRLLWHQNLNRLLRYNRLPRQTTNFDLYPISKVIHKSKKTLGSVVTVRHSKTIVDPIITEIWPADEVSMYTGFFYELLAFYNASLDTGEHLIWYPKDRTDKAFSIQPIDLVAGSSTEMDINPKNKLRHYNYRYLTTEIKFSFRIRRIVDIPEASAVLGGV